MILLPKLHGSVARLIEVTEDSGAQSNGPLLHAMLYCSPLLSFYIYITATGCSSSIALFIVIAVILSTRSSAPSRPQGPFKAEFQIKMVVGWTLQCLRRGAFTCQIEHCDPFRKPTENFEERRKYRQELWNTWLNSVADDLDMITDWLFFLQMYDLYGISVDGGMYSVTTLALLVSTVMGSISYLAELYQVVILFPATFQWLPLFTILLEDVPQIILSLVLSQSFSADATPLVAFNIATSLYSALIKISGELVRFFLYQFVPVADIPSFIA